MFPTSERAANITTLVKLITKILMISHAFSCVWIWLARYEIQNNEPNWIEAKDYALFEWYNQYLSSYYFVMVTMITVGYGDVSPVSNKERLLCICTMLVTCGVFAYAVNSIDGLLRDIYQYELDIKKNMKIINKYMSKKNISNNLQYHIRQYLDYVWRESSEDSEQERIIIEQLSDILKEKLLIEANKIVLIDSPVFRKNFSQELIQKTVQLITEYKSTPEEELIYKGELDDCSIYFIEKGKVEIYFKTFPENETHNFQSIKVLQKGESFGLFSFFSGQARNFDIRSSEFTSLLMIRRKDFLSLLQDFPEDYEKFCYLRDSLQFMNAQVMVGVKCFSCNSYEHQVDSCPYVHYKPPHMRIIQKFNYYLPNDRNLFDRLDTLKFGTIKENVRVLSRMKNFHNDFEQILDKYEDTWCIEEPDDSDEEISEQNQNQSNIIEEQSNESQSSQEQQSNYNKPKDNNSNSNQEENSSQDQEGINEDQENPKMQNNQSMVEKLPNIEQHLNNYQQNNNNINNNNINNKSEKAIILQGSNQDQHDLNPNFQLEDKNQYEIVGQDLFSSQNLIKRNSQPSKKEDLTDINPIGNQSNLMLKQRASLSTNLLQIDEDDSQRSSDDTPNMYYQKNQQKSLKKQNNIIKVKTRIQFLQDNSKNSSVDIKERSYLSSEEEQNKDYDQAQEIDLEDQHLNNAFSHEYQQASSINEFGENKEKSNSKITRPDQKENNFQQENSDFNKNIDQNPIRTQKSKKKSRSQSYINKISSQNENNINQTYHSKQIIKNYRQDAESELNNSISDQPIKIQSIPSQKTDNQELFPLTIQQSKSINLEDSSEEYDLEDSCSQYSNKEYQYKEDGLKIYKNTAQKNNIVQNEEDQLSIQQSQDKDDHNNNNNREKQIYNASSFTQQQQQQQQETKEQKVYGSNSSEGRAIFQQEDVVLKKACETMEKIVERASFFDLEQKISAEIDCFARENLLNLEDEAEINMGYTLEDEQDLYPKITVITEEEWSLNNQKKLEQEQYQQEYEAARKRDLVNTLISQQNSIIDQENVNARSECPIPQNPKLKLKKKKSNSEQESSNSISQEKLSQKNIGNQEQQSQKKSDMSLQQRNNSISQQQQQQQLINLQQAQQKNEVKQHPLKRISSHLISYVEDDEKIRSRKLSSITTLNPPGENQQSNIIGSQQIYQQSPQKNKNKQFSNLKLNVGTKENVGVNNNQKNSNAIQNQLMQNQLKHSKSQSLEDKNQKQQQSSSKKKQRDLNLVERKQIKSKTMNKKDIQNEQSQDQYVIPKASKQLILLARQGTDNLENNIKKNKQGLKIEKFQETKQLQQQDSQSSNSLSSARNQLNKQLSGQQFINGNNQGTGTGNNNNTSVIGNQSNPNSPRHDPSCENNSANNRPCTEDKSNKMNFYRRPSMRNSSLLFKQISGLNNTNTNTNNQMQMNTQPEFSPSSLLQVQQSGSTLQTAIPNLRRPSGIVTPSLGSQGSGIIGLSTAQKNHERRASVFAKTRSSFLGNTGGNQIMTIQQQLGIVSQQQQNSFPMQNLNSYTGQNYIQPSNTLNTNGQSAMSPFSQQRKNSVFWNPILDPNLMQQQQQSSSQLSSQLQQIQIPYPQQNSDNANLGNIIINNNPQNTQTNFDLHPALNPYAQQFQHNQDNQFMINFYMFGQFDIMKKYNYYFKKNNFSLTIDQYNILQNEIQVRRDRHDKEEKEKKKKLLGYIFKKKDKTLIQRNTNIKLSRRIKSKNFTQSYQLTTNPISDNTHGIQSHTNINMTNLPSKSSPPLLKSKLLVYPQKQVISHSSQLQTQDMENQEPIKYINSNKSSQNTSMVLLNSNSASKINGSSNLITSPPINGVHVDHRLKRQDARDSLFQQGDEQEIQQQQVQEGQNKSHPSIHLLDEDNQLEDEKEQVNKKRVTKDKQESSEELIFSQTDLVGQEISGSRASLSQIGHGKTKNNDLHQVFIQKRINAMFNSSDRIKDNKN